MHITTAYERRETLSESELVRLRAALADEVERYEVAIRGYNEDKMREFGQPYLLKLQKRVDVVSELLRQRGIGIA